MKIALIGDIALFGGNNANGNYQAKFRTVRDYLSKYDLVVGNLETPLTEASRIIGGKSAYIKGLPSDVELLRYLGITHVSLANNHMFDYCEKGLGDTIAALESSGIRWYGIKDQTQTIEDLSSKVRLHGYCCFSTNGKGMESYIDVLDPFKIEADIEKDRRDGVLSLLSIHWGQEHVHYPNYDHVLVARELTTKTPIIIHGHHPHVLQGIETIGESLIAYSLGNFCFDDVYTSKSKEPLIKLSGDNQEAMVLGVEIIDNRIIDIEIQGFSFNKDGYQEMPSIEDKIIKWSEFLNIDETEYRAIRQEELNAYIEARKKKRDIQWYLKRMNMESVRMLLSGRSNQREYEKLVNKYIRGI